MCFSICILDGGASSRMGTDKSQLYFEGKKLIDNLILTAENFSQDVFIAGIRKSKDQHVNLFTDAVSGKGPLSGLQTALDNGKNDWVLILPCDMPLIDAEVLQWLQSEFRSLKNEKIAIVSNEDKLHYLVGFYHRSKLRQIRDALKSDNLRVRQLLNSEITKHLKVPSSLRSNFINLNSPEDLSNFGHMKIKIVAFGQAAEIIQQNELQWVTKQKDIAGLKMELLSSFPELNNITFNLALNESLVENAFIKMNDTIAILPPFAGG